MKFKAISISKENKIKLGIMIKSLRLKRFNEFKKENLIENNPYTKENFCERNFICHYHTLTKLETSYIRDNSLYHYFLQKLGLSFQVKEEEHKKYIKTLIELAWEVLDLFDRFTISKKDSIYEKLNSIVIDSDCISSSYLDLLKQSIDVFLEEKVNEDKIELLEALLPIYDNIFKPIAYQTVGYGYYLLKNYEFAEKYCEEAISHFKHFKVDKGIKYYPLIEVYMKNNNYYEAIKICNELETYYVLANNKPRLLSIYVNLVEYYLMINSVDFAKKYYNEVIYLVKNDESIYKDKIFLINYYWGYYELAKYDFKTALNYFELAYKNCDNINNKLLIINRILIYRDYLEYTLTNDELIEEGQNYYQYASLLDRKIFDYFLTKNDDNKQIITEVISMLKHEVKEKNLLLYFYERLNL